MEADKTNKLVLKSVGQLLEYSFFIPSYQRGYRWTHTQVIQLLDDIWKFAENPPLQERGKEKPFYCLQPVVIKKHNENEWEVIDGQQRLTTIALVIHYFNEMWIGKQKINEPIISYETRNTSQEFISSIEINTNIDFNLNLEIEEALNKIILNSKYKPQENIDFFHIANAYKSIHFWVHQKGNELDNNKLQSIFQNTTKVIWYEVEETENNNSIDIFTRLNIGKIPLTNSELIKASFLQKGNFSEGKATLKQIQVATEWDMIEKTLQDDSFWLFIYNPDNPIKYTNRIEYIFDLMKKRTKDSEYYHTFNEFCKDFETNSKDNKPDIDKIWSDIKSYFLTFEEWYKDYELYHYVGYFVDSIDKPKDKNKYVENIIEKINTLKKNSEKKTKIDFKSYLRDEIKKQVNCNLDEIEYGDKHIKKVLLLFNILTVLETQKSDMRFPFYRYKSEDWDIEHVCSQTDKTITGKKRFAWVEDILEYLTGTTDVQKATSFANGLDVNDEKEKEIKGFCDSLVRLLKEEKIEDELFDTTFLLLQKYFKEDNQIEEKDNISNLTLLDSITNRSYGNSFFPIKRKRIIENDSKGIFVPICTKNLFLKYYSKRMGGVMYWNIDDAKDYLESIKKMLNDYLPKEDNDE